MRAYRIEMMGGNDEYPSLLSVSTPLAGPLIVIGLLGVLLLSINRRMSHSPRLPTKTDALEHYITTAGSPLSNVQQNLAFEEKISAIHIKIIAPRLPKGCKTNHIRRKLAVKTVPTSKRRMPLDQQQLSSVKEEEKRKLALQERRENLLINRMKRQAYLEEMEQINKNYCQFMKQFKKTKPLYEIKEEEFQHRESLDFQVRRQRTLNRLRGQHRSLNLEEIKEHQKRYTRTKATIETSVACSPQQIGLDSNKRCFRGKADAEAEKIRQFKERLKQKEHESVIKMKQYCEKVLSKVKETIGDNKWQRSRTQPASSSDTVVKNVRRVGYFRRSSQCEHLRVSQSSQPSHVSPQTETVQTSPKPRQRRPRVVRDRYDLEQLIYENQRKDRRLIQNQQLMRLGRRPKLDEAIKLQDDYVDSIREKISILSSKC